MRSSEKLLLPFFSFFKLLVYR